MMEHDLLAEVFHREVVKQEEAQARRKLTEAHDAEVQRLRDEIQGLKLDHDNEKIKMRWEHADEVGSALQGGGQWGGEGRSGYAPGVALLAGMSLLPLCRSLLLLSILHLYMVVLAAHRVD